MREGLSVKGHPLAVSYLGLRSARSLGSKGKEAWGDEFSPDPLLDTRGGRRLYSAGLGQFTPQDIKAICREIIEERA